MDNLDVETEIERFLFQDKLENLFIILMNIMKFSTDRPCIMKDVDNEMSAEIYGEEL